MLDSITAAMAFSSGRAARKAAETQRLQVVRAKTLAALTSWIQPPKVKRAKPPATRKET